MQHLALLILRICTGITFMILGLHNKLLEPSLAIEFLQKYHFNFINNMGFEAFSDLHFVLTAGGVEVVVGGLITLGIAVRFVVFLTSFFFVTTLFLLGIEELLGHAPIFCIAILLIARGGGALKQRTVDLSSLHKITSNK